jgi:capsular polysaccharide transport system permease protein
MNAPAEKKQPDARASLSEVTPLATPERAQLSATRAHAQAVRSARSRRLVKQLGVFVLLPTALAAGYFAGLASPQYESYATFGVQSSELRPSLGMDGILAGLATSGGAGRDALAVRDFIMSRDMLARLEKEQGFIAHYKDKRADFFTRLRADASFEKAYDYFDGKVHVNYDQLSGSVTVRVRAFGATEASKYAAAIIRYSEEMVNKLSERERRDRTATTEADVKKAEERLSNARMRIVSLQREHDDFNPLQTATAAMTIRTALEGELAKARAELMQLKSFMHDGAPQVRAVNEKVKSLSAQVSGESRKLVNPSKPGSLSTSLVDFEGAMVEKEFAQKAYESAMAALEIAKADADRQHRYIALIASPSKPDESTFPHRVRSVVAAFLISLLLWGVVSMLSAAVREHARL